MEQKPKQWVQPPAPTYRGAPVIYTGVRVAEDEKVRWNWTHTPEGSYVSGFKIVKQESKDKQSDNLP